MEALETLLTATFNRMSGNFGVEDVVDLTVGMANIYDEAKSSGHLEQFRDICQTHPLSRVILEDPFSRRAYDKPRGYAGDAVMLDYIFRPLPISLTQIGAVVHETTTTQSCAKSIIWRRNYLAELLIRTLETDPAGTILSVASGHMRELDIVTRKTSSRNAEIWALDQDQESIEECVRSYPDFKIRPICQSISHVFKGRLPQHHFDLIYTAGLSDYLPDNVLCSLLRKLYPSAKPGATIVVGNFTTNTHGRGFMEGLMNWSLIYRNEKHLSDIVRDALPGVDFRSFCDEIGDVAYVEIAVR